MLQNPHSTYLRKCHVSDLICFTLSWVPYALLTYRFWWVCDDAFISFRYARNWALGNGLRYNLGDHIPVEGFSNFLWVAVCAVVEYFKLSITFWPLMLSFLCGSTLLYLFFNTLRYRLALNLPQSCMAVLFLGCSPPFAVWSTSGLETMPFTLLIFITFERLILRRHSIAPIVAGIAGLALGLMRTDGIYWAILLAIITIISRRLASQKYRREIFIFLVITLVGYGIYWVCRYSYYYLPFSNTTYAKIDLSAATLVRGIYYVIIQFLTTNTLFIIAPGFFVALSKGRLPIGIPILIMSMAAIAYSILTSGDFMPFGRFLLPTLVFNTILFAWMLKDVGGQSTRRRISVYAIALIVIGFGVLPGWDINMVPESFRVPFHFRHNSPDYHSEYAIWHFAKRNSESWVKEGKLLKKHTKPGDSLVEGPIGAVGYYSGLFIYDRNGLVNREVAFMDVKNRPPRSPGHDKKVRPEFFINKKPTIMFSCLVTDQELSLHIQRMKRRAIANHYVAEYFSISEGNDNRGPSGSEYLLILRHIKEGANPDTAWHRVMDSLAEINGY